jgi:hypothetical protein
MATVWPAANPAALTATVWPSVSPVLGLTLTRGPVGCGGAGLEWDEVVPPRLEVVVRPPTGRPEDLPAAEVAAAAEVDEPGVVRGLVLALGRGLVLGPRDGPTPANPAGALTAAELVPSPGGVCFVNPEWLLQPASTRIAVSRTSNPGVRAVIVSRSVIGRPRAAAAHCLSRAAGAGDSGRRWGRSLSPEARVLRDPASVGCPRGASSSLEQPP